MTKFDPSKHKLIYAPHESLVTATKPFPLDDIEFRKSVSNHMKDVMLQHSGIGLAAPQIGLGLSVHVQLIGNQPVALFNPQILAASNDKVLMSEGCLSEPGLYLKVSRPKTVTVSWEDENGNVYNSTLDGLDARIFLHEFDHLHGILFTDRVSKLKLQMARKKQTKLVRRAASKILDALTSKND